MTEYKEVSNSDVCMVDGKLVKEGYKVKDSDIIINIIRKVKERFGIIRNNRLYICKEHIEFYRKKRKSYERIVLIVLGLLGILLFLGVFLPLLWGTLSLLSLVSYFMIASVMLFLLAFLHVPAVEEQLTIIEKKDVKSRTQKPKKPKKKTTKKRKMSRT